MDGSFQVPSLNQDNSLVASMCDLRGGVYSEPSTSFPLDAGLMSLNGLSTLQGSTFSFPAPIAQPTDAYLALQGAPASKHGHGAAPLGPQKLTLEKYREKHAADLEQKRRHEDDGEQHRKHGHLSSDASSSSRAKYSQVQERPSKSGSLKRRHPDSAENGVASQEELKMKIKVSSESGKGRHSPRSGREKHREHSSHKSRSDSSHGGHHHHHHHHHHHSSKTHRSSKSHSSSASAPVNQALGHAHLAKIDRRPGEGQSSEGNAALMNNGPHMDYEDTFNMLDSLLNAHNF